VKIEPRASGSLLPLSSGSDLDRAAFLSVLESIRGLSGVDLRLYRSGMVERRVLSRVRASSEVSLESYRDRLLADPREVERMIEHVTIKVSHFFRNPDVFQLLGERVLPDLLRQSPSRPLRIWSAGCARGEEAYSLAILLGERVDRRECPPPIICGTDIDSAALSNARAGLYSRASLGPLPPELIERNFSVEMGKREPSYVVASRLRSWVAFLQHDLTNAGEQPGTSRFDLICCRNVLIYLHPAAQERVNWLLARALRPGGYLCLGEADSLSPLTRSLFEEVDRKACLYRRPGEE
jgi:chemotaxis methyl-accepting protein methylase